MLRRCWNWLRRKLGLVVYVRVYEQANSKPLISSAAVVARLAPPPHLRSPTQTATFLIVPL